MLSFPHQAKARVGHMRRLGFCLAGLVFIKGKKKTCLGQSKPHELHSLTTTLGWVLL